MIRYTAGMTISFLQSRLDNLETIIIAYDDAILALLTGGAQSYTLDTGQTRQTVTKLNLAELQRTRESLYNQYVTLEARLKGTGVVNVGPAW